MILKQLSPLIKTFVDFKTGVKKMKIEFLQDEYWYGGAVHFGYKMPADCNSDIMVNLVTAEDIADQYSPLFISSKGRYIYSDKPFVIHFNKGSIDIEGSGEIELSEGHGTLKNAQLAAAKKYFSLEGKIPNPLFLKLPQYNTWIELMYNQNQKQILEYAHSLVDAGMEPGVLMIDEGWSPDYGDYDFCARKFYNPKAMVKELHDLGFKVMLWVVPLISPDSNCYRELRDTDYLIKDKDGNFAIRQWWNGHSCILDLSNPKACKWFKEKLKTLKDKYDIDGFKFDAGGSYLYKNDDKTYLNQESCEHTRSFDIFGSEFEFNEIRCVWNLGGSPIVCRLQDKTPTWDSAGGYDLGFSSLIPNMLAQGLLGYFYGCPDMIGGGGYGSFLEKGYKTDEELYIRWLEASVLCPMMQFSISPKRILSKKSFKTVLDITKIHSKYADLILELAKKASNTGEPVMRYMEYEFPNEGFEKVTDQFMLGDKILVAPVNEKGSTTRRVKLPLGIWQYLDGKEYAGGTEVEVEAPLDVLPIFIKK